MTLSAANCATIVFLDAPAVSEAAAKNGPFTDRSIDDLESNDEVKERSAVVVLSFEVDATFSNDSNQNGIGKQELLHFMGYFVCSTLSKAIPIATQTQTVGPNLTIDH